MSNDGNYELIKGTTEQMPLFVLIQMGVLSFIIAMHNVLGLNINQYLILAFASFVIPFLKIEHLLPFSAFLIPLETGINGSLFIFLSAAILYRLPRVSPIMIIFPLIIFSIEILDIFCLVHVQSDFKKEIIYASFLFLFFIMLFVDTDTNLSKKILRYFIIGLAVVSAIYILRVLHTGTISMLLSSGGRTGEGIAEAQSENIGYITLNANTLGYFSAVGIALCLLGNKILNIKPALLIACLFMFIIAGITTVSRTWAMTAALALALYFLRSINKPWIWICIIAVIYAVMSFDLIPEPVIESFSRRFTDTDNMATAGGRSEIFERYNTFMLDNPEYLLFGIGVFDYDILTKVGHSMHNGLQQIFVSTGVFGLFMFVTAACKFYKLYIRPYPGPMMRWIPLIIAAIFLQSIQFLNPHILMMPLVMTTFVFKIRDWGNH